MDHYRPLPAYLTVGDSRIHGLGIIAKDNIDSGTNLGISHIKDSRYPDGLIRTPLGGFINHSDKPNCDYKIKGKHLTVVTNKKILKGEELTVSYRGWYNDKVLDSFK